VAQVTGTHLSITGSAAAVEAEFAVELHTLVFRAPVGTPTVAASIADSVAGVVGFDTIPRNRPRLRHALKHAATRPLPITSNSSGTTNPPGELLVTDFAQYYDVDPLYDVGLNGRGRTIGIVTFASFRPKDAFAYWSAVGLSVASNRITVVDVDGGSGPPSDAAGSDETTLDVEQSGGISPASKIEVYEAPNNSQGFVDDFAKVIDANVADTISCSWGEWEFFDTLTTNGNGDGPVKDPTSGHKASILQAVNDVLLQGALQGQSMYIASGDAGAYDTTDYFPVPSYPPPATSVVLSVDDPGVQQWATDVGGTTLAGPQVYAITATETVTINIPTEQAWGWDYLAPLCKALGADDPVTCGTYSVGTGGGVSSFVPRPFYQEGVAGMKATAADQTLNDQTPPSHLVPIFVTLPGGYTGRNVPDIALNADPQTGYVLYYTSSETGFGIDQEGGTSFAAPQMNGVTALFDEALGHRVGLLNSTLYDLVREGHAYGGSQAPLRDIKAGDNWYYHGLPGYDRTTGVGVPDFAKLLEAIVDQETF
jgi:subtilase family serine protease